jgi:hypothetical protein
LVPYEAHPIGFCLIFQSVPFLIAGYLGKLPLLLCLSLLILFFVLLFLPF